MMVLMRLIYLLLLIKIVRCDDSQDLGEGNGPEALIIPAHLLYDGVEDLLSDGGEPTDDVPPYLTTYWAGSSIKNDPRSDRLAGLGVQIADNRFLIHEDSYNALRNNQYESNFLGLITPQEIKDYNRKTLDVSNGPLNVLRTPMYQTYHVVDRGLRPNSSFREVSKEFNPSIAGAFAYWNDLDRYQKKPNSHAQVERDPSMLRNGNQCELYGYSMRPNYPRQKARRQRWSPGRYPGASANRPQQPQPRPQQPQQRPPQRPPQRPWPRPQPPVQQWQPPSRLPPQPSPDSLRNWRSMRPERQITSNRTLVKYPIQQVGECRRESCMMKIQADASKMNRDSICRGVADKGSPIVCNGKVTYMVDRAQTNAREFPCSSTINAQALPHIMG